MRKVFEALVVCILASVFVIAQTPTPTPDAEKIKNDPEYRKKWEEYEKQLAEVQEKNKKIAETNAKIQRLVNEGSVAYQNKNYELALSIFREAETLDDYWGMLAVILTNKAIVLRVIGTEKYNKAVKSKTPTSISSQPYFSEAVTSLEKAVKVLEENKNSIEPGKQETFNKYKYNAIKELADCYRLLAMNEVCDIPKAIKAYEDYISLEQDELLNVKAKKELDKLKHIIYVCKTF